MAKVHEKKGVEGGTKSWRWAIRSMEECVLVDVVRRKKTGGWKIAALAAQRDAEAGLLPARTGFWAHH